MAQFQFVSAGNLVEAVSGLEGYPDVYISVDGSGKILAGTNPVRPEFGFDFQSESFCSITGEKRSDLYKTETKASIVRPLADRRTAPPPPLDKERSTGLYAISIDGIVHNFRSQKQLLRETILIFSHLDPVFMDRLSKEGTKRRRLVAKDPSELFQKKHLAKTHSEKLPNNWWLNTNNSRQQTLRWINIIKRICGHPWADGVRTSLDHEI